MKAQRHSAKRDAILDALRKSSQPLSMKELHEKLNKRGTPLDFSTVFRQVTQLKEAGLVDEMFLDQAIPLYELREAHHHHFYCSSCGKVQHIDLPTSIESVDETLNKQYGFNITHHRLDFFGLCTDCA